MQCLGLITIGSQFNDLRIFGCRVVVSLFFTKKYDPAGCGGADTLVTLQVHGHHRRPSRDLARGLVAGVDRDPLTASWNPLLPTTSTCPPARRSGVRAGDVPTV